MGAYEFLAGLPAALGIVGFFAYLWKGQSRIGGELLQKIVDKLRADPNIDVKEYGLLTPAKLRSLVRSDERVRRAVNDDDRKLLRLLIILQFLLTGLVLVVCAVLIGFSVWLYTRGEPLSIEQTGPTAVVEAAQGSLVDLDPLKVEWLARGRDETVSVWLENVDTHERTEKKTVSSSVRSVVFEAADVISVASNRSYHGKNRIRAVIEWRRGTSVSPAKDMMVGIMVDLLLYGHEISPSGKERTVHTLFATIDRSTERLPADYFFKGDFVAVTTNGPLVVPLSSKNSIGEIAIPGLDLINWARPIGFVYDGPDDQRIVRTHVSGKADSDLTSRK